MTPQAEVPVRRTLWDPAYRIIPSRYPPVGLFDRVADPDDFERVYELEALTNDRRRDEVGELKLVPPEEPIAGPNTTVIMAAFTHLNPQGSRFSDGSYGVFYTAHTLPTAIRETAFHRATFMRATNQPAMDLEMRVYHVRLGAALHDIRGRQADLASIYSPTSYADSQVFARQLRAGGSYGIVYDSVRHQGGQSAGVFRPRALSNCVARQHLSYQWDGREIIGVYRKSPVALD